MYYTKEFIPRVEDRIIGAVEKISEELEKTLKNTKMFVCDRRKKFDTEIFIKNVKEEIEIY